jgi:WD40 repeat protein
VTVEIRGSVLGLAFSLAGQTVATAVLSRVSFCVLTTGVSRNAFSISDIRAIAYSPDEHFLACVGSLTDGPPRSVRLWDVEQQEMRWVYALEDHAAWHEHDLMLAYSPDGQILAVALYSEMVLLIDAKTMALLCRMDDTLSVYNLSFSPAGDLLAVPKSEDIHIHGIADNRDITIVG